MTTETTENLAQRIAARGRDALLERLRPAFKDAAAKHADVLKLSDEEIEQMVQRAADRADGLQWRRALAGVATEELGIGLGEALAHPAVVRAHAILGVPSYEEAPLTRPPAASPPDTEVEAQRGPEAEAEAEREPEPEPEAERAPEPEPEAEREPDPEPEPEPEQAPEPEPEAEAEAEPDAEADAEPEPDAEPQPSSEPEPEQPEERVEIEPLTADHPVGAAAPTPEDDEPGDVIRLAVIHLGGVATLTAGERDIELQISNFGLDIVRGTDPLGRLTWSDIQTLSVPSPKGLRRRRREGRAHLVIHTDHGDASFEVPAVAPEELREHLTPIVARHGRTVDTL